MAKLNIIKEGDDTLRKVCRPVKDITPRTLTLLDDMRETLLAADGVGLAAPQVGVLRRIALVIDTDKDDMIYELINPEIIERDGEQHELEGCLSVPGKWGFTNRPMTVTVKATDRHGKEFTVNATGLTARCLCHEIDHLDGTLFIDHAEMVSEEELEQMMN